MLRPGASDDAIVAAFGQRGQRRRAQSHAGRRRRDAAARRPADADRQDEHGDVARVPGAAARPRAGRDGGAHCRRRQGARRRAEARHEARAGRPAAARDPGPQEARLRHADGRMAQARSRAGAARPARARGRARARPLPAGIGTAADRRPRRQPHRRHRSPAGAHESRDLEPPLPRRARAGDVAAELKALDPSPPAGLPRSSPHEDSLPLPPLSVPAQARRQDPAVQHDPAPRRSSTR